MPKFLIEVPHGESQNACLQAVEFFIKSGNHFLSHAEWGCKDNVHKAWMIVELDDKEQAQRIIPSMYRNDATITELYRVTREDVKNYKTEKRVKNTEDFHN